MKKALLYITIIFSIFFIHKAIESKQYFNLITMNEATGYEAKDFNERSAQTKNETTICIVEYEDEHKEVVMTTASMFTKANLKHIEGEDFFNNHINEKDFSNCNIFNISLATPIFTYHNEKNFEYLLNKYDSMFVFAGGNDIHKNSNDKQKFQKVKTIFKDELNKVIFVGQYNEEEDSNQYSYGESLDILAPTNNLEVNGEIVNGTSIGAPMVSAKIANILMKKGSISSEELKELTLKTNKKTVVTKEKRKSKDEPEFYKVLDLNF